MFIDKQFFPLFSLLYFSKGVEKVFFDAYEKTNVELAKNSPNKMN